MFTHHPSHLPSDLVWILLVAFTTTTIADGATPDRLDPDNLLQYHDQSGVIRPVQTPADWQYRRAEILRGMREIMGEMPGDGRRGPPGIEVIEEADAGTYVRRLITYRSGPGSLTPTPAYLCIPKAALAGQCKAPAVLCLHPTDGTHGHQVVVGLGGKDGRAYAKELAERGYVTLSPSYPLMAGYQPELEKLGHASGTMKAIWDNSRGLDLLASLACVDSARGFGAIGHSLGGHNAIFTAVMDERITVIASSCGFDSFRDYYGGADDRWRAGEGWCQDRYMPKLADYRGRLGEIPFDFHELLGALAPRVLFISAPLKDSNFAWESVDSCARAARPIYRLFGAEGKLITRHPDCDHGFPEELRDQAYAAIDSVLRPVSSER